MNILLNTSLLAALISIIFAQMIKIPIHFFATKKFKPELVFSTGGMPSSHSAAVAALTTSIGFIEGVESPTFAVSLIFSIIVMFDSSGVRRQSGEHAILLNQLIKDVQYFADEIKDWKHKEKIEKREEIKEMLGHQPIEVFFGGLLGVGVAILLHFL
ncbi:MAG TPA: divergent PAP2 family protein [Bacillota bacterium]|nr:divergent PAP2 family protein [Bacillota bacterium]